MALAYVILAHKNPRQVRRLFDALYRPEDTIVLHADRRSEKALHETVKELGRGHPNVIVLRPRAVLWGHFRMAEVQIEAMAAALRTGAEWHHFINLSGQDFPIKPLDVIDATLAAGGDRNYVSWFDPVYRPLWKNARDRLVRHYIESAWLERMLKLPFVGRRARKLLGWRNHLPHVPLYRREWPTFHYYGGANHVVLSRAGCDHLCGDAEAQEIIEWLRHSAHANEIVYQSVLLNSRLASTVVNAHWREIDFPLNSPHPRTFRSSDFDRLVRSPMLFARKFDDNVDVTILDRLTAYVRAEAPVVSAESLPTDNADEV